MRVKPTQKKTWLTMLMLALMLAFLPGMAFAADTHTTSEACVEKIKEFEDLRLTAYPGTNGKWYIGYGSTCGASEYPNGISAQKAEELLRKDLATAEEVVNGMLAQYGISVGQHQFDALVDMTYNLGRQWINPEYRFCAYLIDGIENYLETEVVNAIATWCHTGETVMDHLASRRLWEAFLFLYGDYGNNGAESYCYIDYEVNGGVKDPQQSSRTSFYPVGAPFGELPVPTKDGQSFLGWFTEDGTQVTGEEIAVRSLRVYARWGSESETPIPTQTIPTQPAVDYSSWVNPYRDVPEEAWYYPYIRELSYYGVVNGKSDGYFEPGSTLSTGEALKMILLAATQAVDPGNCLTGGHWASNYLALGEGLGCVIPGEFQDLNAEIDRATVARITAAAMGLELKDGASPFADVEGDPYVLTLFEAGIALGETVDGHRYYHPDQSITRAEACTIVSRVRGYAPANNPMTSGYIEYNKTQIPVLWNVPTAPYNKDLLVRDGSIMYYYDPNYSTAIGIDVSRHQGTIDWQKVAASGMVEFAFLRVGGRYAESGGIYDDAEFLNNIAGAKAAGIKVGVYFYSTAVTVEEAIEEAEFVLNYIRPYSLEYPVVFDWEILSKTSRNANLSKSALTACAQAFCQRIALEWYTPMIYVGLDTAYNRLDLSQLTNYDLWFAQYNSRNQPDMYYNYRIWQYTDSGTVPGISGKVDMNIAFIPYR
ncbi:MAG: S-layer homology domain-containing protein [Oscillospiraceae bacterium]|nr:S-layer homology domain-containing protein [Oscillospiraceae bacterium]